LHIKLSKEYLSDVHDMNSFVDMSSFVHDCKKLGLL
jgi:hypothetical protein